MGVAFQKALAWAIFYEILRFKHLQELPMLDALPRAVDNLENYERHEGEVISGQILSREVLPLIGIRVEEGDRPSALRFGCERTSQ